MNVGVAIYYRNIDQYPKRWVNKCIESIDNQTYVDWSMYVLNYGEHEGSFSIIGNENKLISLRNHVAAINCIYEWIFQTCDVAVNVNIDDYCSSKRIELLLNEIEKGADIVSSNYCIVDKRGKITSRINFADVDIYRTLTVDRLNPVCNGCHIMHKRVFDSGIRFNDNLNTGADMDMWKRCIEAGFKIKIVPEYLYYYRMHENQITRRKIEI